MYMRVVNSTMLKLIHLLIEFGTKYASNMLCTKFLRDNRCAKSCNMKQRGVSGLESLISLTILVPVAGL